MAINIDTDKAIGFVEWLIPRLTWKLLAKLIIAGVVGLLCTIVYQCRLSLIANFINSNATPAIVVERIPAVASTLLKDTGNGAVRIFMLNANTDTKRLMYSSIAGDTSVGEVSAAFPSGANERDLVVRVIKGEVFCVPSQEKTSGGVEYCYMHLPPSYKDVAGFIELTIPPGIEHNGVYASMIRAANKLYE
jgi:hypothetical protein